MTIIGIAADGAGFDAPVGPRFGRAPYLLLVEPGSMMASVIAHPTPGPGSGASVAAAQLLVRHGADAAVAGDFGPNAQEALAGAGIAMYRCPPGLTVWDATELVADGELTPLPPPIGAGA